MSLSACLRTLYAARCAPAEAPLYGRWGDRTLRLVQGRVETSKDNRNFRLLTARAPDCAAGAGA
jgi:hypothetical protein